jgi:hypothetical protein
VKNEYTSAAYDKICAMLGQKDFEEAHQSEVAETQARTTFVEELLNLKKKLPADLVPIDTTAVQNIQSKFPWTRYLPADLVNEFPEMNGIVRTVKAATRLPSKSKLTSKMQALIHGIPQTG